jgi:transposase
MESVKDERISIKFSFKVGKTTAETHKMLPEAYGDDALSETTNYEWFRRFKNGRTSTNDNERSGRSSTSRSEILIAKNICVNRRLTVREAAEEIGIFIHSCHTILMEDLKMHRISANFLPKLLTDEGHVK